MLSIRSVLAFAISFLLFVAISQAQNAVDIQVFPTYRQLFPRDLATNMGQAKAEGSVAASSGYVAMKLSLYRNNELYSVQTIDLSYTENRADFQFTVDIPAELASFRLELAGLNGAFETPIASADELVAGEVFIINGQSNAIAGAGMHPNDYDLYARSYSSGLGWELMNRTFPGLWGGRLAKSMITELGMPVAIFNEAEGGKEILHFLKDDANPEAGNYGKMRRRLEAAGVADRIRAVLWYQGETDGWLTTLEEYKTRFKDLYDDWMADYRWPRVYLFQVRYQMCGHPSPAIMEAQRQLARELDQVEIMSTTKATTDASVRCHFEYLGGHDKLGNQLYALMASQMYGQPSFDVAPADVGKITFVEPDLLELEMTSVDGELLVEGWPWSDFALEGGNVSISDGWTDGHKIYLQLSAVPHDYTGLSYYGHADNAERWIVNSRDVGLLNFWNHPICNDCEQPQPSADIELSLSADRTDDLQVDDVVQLQLQLSNKGPEVATNLSVKTILPDYISISTDDPNYATAANTWSVAQLAVDASIQLTLEARIHQLDNAFTIGAELATADLPDPDSSPGNFDGQSVNEDDEAQLTFSPKPTADDKTDLSLSIRADRQNFEIYEFIDLEIVLQNSSAKDADNVQVAAKLPEGLAFTESEISQGTYADWDGLWRLGKVVAGSTQTLKLRLFTLQEEQISFYTQVVQQDTEDKDSAPGNGVQGQVIEDDEAVLILTPGPGEIDRTPPLAVLTSSQSTVLEAFTVAIRFSEAIQGLEIEDFAIENGSIENLNGSGQNYSLQVLPREAGLVKLRLLSGKVMDLEGNVNPVSNELIVRFEPIEGDFVDLELSLEADETVFEIFDFVVFELKVENKGNIAAKDLLIDFPFPEDFVFTEKSETLGDYNDWLQEWAIDELGAGEEATLSLTLFSLKEDGPRKAFAQLVASSPLDWDAMPDNDQDQTADEDDEALVDLQPLRSSANQRQSTQSQSSASTASLQIAPNPVSSRLWVQWQSDASAKAEIHIHAATGQRVFSRSLSSAAGQNQLDITLADLPAGVYFISLTDGASNPQILSFVKR
ncbi:MAG: sialate O-acetylesterase [Bacteroidota bacterium]